jgi:transposase-like protein
MNFKTNRLHAKKYDNKASAQFMVQAIKQTPEHYGLTTDRARSLGVLCNFSKAENIDGTVEHSKFWLVSVRLQENGRKHFYTI